ncbi:MAG: DUF2804 domain-containing protein [Termitinemataceae bacterium]
MEQVEITTELPLLNEKGRLDVPGWARRPLWSYSRGSIRGLFTRIVESDRYILLSEMAIVLVEVTNRGRMTYCSVQVTDLVHGTSLYDSFRLSTPLGYFEMPGAFEKGSIKIKQKNISIDFSLMIQGARLVKLDIPSFYKGTGLRGVVVLTPPGSGEPLATAARWRRDNHAFRYAVRAPWYIAEGVLQVGNDEIIFTKDNGWGMVDWNRSLYPRGELHFLALASGFSGGRQVAMTIGYGMEDNSAGTENALFLDGRLYKLNQVTFRINPRDWTAPWRFTNDTQQLEMDFQPVYEYRNKRSMFFQHQKERIVFGYFSGIFTQPDSEPVRFYHIPGFAERIKTSL